MSNLELLKDKSYKTRTREIPLHNGRVLRTVQFQCPKCKMWVGGREFNGKIELDTHGKGLTIC